MPFNSIGFAIFLPVFLLLYYAVSSRTNWRDVLLLVGSYFFYMSWYWQYAGLIVLSTVVDYWIGRQLAQVDEQSKRKLLVTLSVVVNLGILAIFKYYNFFIDSTQASFAAVGIQIPDLYHQLLLPVGISFYTFQTLSYTIDVYRRKIPHEPSFIKFAVFVSFFPQLVAGPIVRAKDFLPQINRPTAIRSDDIDTGLKLIAIGLFKKIVIADLLAFLIVDSVFAEPSAYSSWDLMLALYAYTFQIYCDFSGYSDIAIGVALLLGFRLPINFDRPYIAQNPSEFWRRWHISLSSWLRDYLYISLGGNRGPKWMTSRNLLLTMLLGGLWHGAAWNFVLWGAFHGLILILFRSLKTEESFNGKAALKMFLNFHLIIFGWLLFRVTGMDNFVDYVAGIGALTSGSVVSPLVYLILIGAALAHFVPRDFVLTRWLETTFDRSPVFVRSAAYAGLVFLFVGASVGAPTFIYFQF
ncbi:MAG: MBOAT family O-acyltransferase [Pseudomonadota bacterium]